VCICSYSNLARDYLPLELRGTRLAITTVGGGIVHLVHFRFERVRVRTERACEIVLQFKMKYNNCYKLLQDLFIRNSTLVLGTGSRAQAQFYDPDKKRIDSNASNKQIGKIR